MPKVKRKSAPEVGINPLPQVRVTKSAPVEAFGGGQELDKQQSHIRQIATNTQNLILREQKKANDIAVQDADFNLAQAQTDIEIEASKAKGRDAAGAIDVMQDSWDERVNELGKSLTNNEQKARFRKIVQQRQISLNKHVQKHVAAELEKYDANSTQAYIDNEREYAARNFADINAIEQSIERQQERFRARAARAGLSDEEIELGVNELISETHESVINKKLANGLVEDAKEYFESNKDQMLSQDSKAIEKIVKEQLVDSNAAAAAQKIMDKVEAASGNFSVAEREISKIKPAADRKRVEKRFEDLKKAKILEYEDRVTEIERSTSGGSYTFEDLQNDFNSGSIPKDYYIAKRHAMRNGTENGNFKSEFDKTYMDLLEEYSKIDDGSFSESSEKLLKYRTNVHLNAHQLTDEKYKQLLDISDPKFSGEVQEKSSFLKGLINSIGSFGNMEASVISNLMSSIFSKANETSNEDMPGMMQDEINKAATKANPGQSKYVVGETYSVGGVTGKAVRRPDGTIGIEVSE